MYIIPSTPSGASQFAAAPLFSAEQVQAGDNLLLAAFGGGLTWAAAVIQCADVEALVTRRKRAGVPKRMEVQHQFATGCNPAV